MKREMTKLSDAEFDLMSLIWDLEPPVTTAMLQDRIQKQGITVWKPQTILTFLSRMERKGFLISEKRGRERYYRALVSREAYLQFETESCMKRYHRNSLASLVDSFRTDDISEQDVAEMEKWLKEREE